MYESFFFSEAAKDFDASKLNPTQKRVLEAAQDQPAPDKSNKGDPSKAIIEPDGILAAYKIEVFFGPERSIFKDTNTCFISVWESGKHFSGGGDDFMYWCADVHQGSDLGCGGLIPSGLSGGGMAQCPHCHRMLNTDHLTGHRLFRKASLTRIAEFVEKTFHRLNDNADIYVKYDKTDPRYLLQVSELGVAAADALLGLTIYPLGRIIKDTSAGASLLGRIKALLSA